MGVGVLLTIAVLGMLTIGVFVLPIALVAVWLIARRDGANGAAWGIVSGMGALLLVVAWLNRSGPGDVCTETATGGSCTEQASPWPWLIAGVALFTVGLSVFMYYRRRESRSPG
jgi:hypothetical protein